MSPCLANHVPPIGGGERIMSPNIWSSDQGETRDLPPVIRAMSARVANRFSFGFKVLAPDLLR